ncbi:MAG TPA: DUF3047 domain-containing protein [Syntrophales bacterium]|nr:DUF3047 domain-containing protein [Syntrophales bacterium]
MRMPTAFRTALLSILLLAAVAAAATERTVLFREDFRTLDAWRSLAFPRIEARSRYSIEPLDGGTVLRAESRGSASGLIHRREFNVYEYPGLRWRWKVSNVYARGDMGGKEGDDYPIRIFVMFHSRTKTPSALNQVSSAVARWFHGENPPHSTLSYIWANREDVPRLFSSPFTERAKMMVLERGSRLAGTWREESVDVLRDYRRAFGVDPPATATLGIMNDSDNTGEASVSNVDFIEVYRDAL